MRRLILILFLCAAPALPLAGCSTLGFEQVSVETQNERLALLEYSYQAALSEIETLTAAGVINASNTDKVTEYLDKSRAALNAARLALSQGSSGSLDYLSLATASLTQLLAYLKEQKNAG